MKYKNIPKTVDNALVFFHNDTLKLQCNEIVWHFFFRESNPPDKQVKMVLLKVVVFADIFEF